VRNSFDHGVAAPKSNTSEEERNRPLASLGTCHVGVSWRGVTLLRDRFIRGIFSVSIAGHGPCSGFITQDRAVEVNWGSTLPDGHSVTVDRAGFHTLLGSRRKRPWILSDCPIANANAGTEMTCPVPVRNAEFDASLGQGPAYRARRPPRMHDGPCPGKSTPLHLHFWPGRPNSFTNITEPRRDA
jgi:hypothetical protein